MTKRKENPTPRASYYYLLDDPDVKCWYDNVERGSVVTAAVWLRRMGFIHKNFGKTPKDLANQPSAQARLPQAHREDLPHLKNRRKRSWVRMSGHMFSLRAMPSRGRRRG